MCTCKSNRVCLMYFSKFLRVMSISTAESVGVCQLEIVVVQGAEGVRTGTMVESIDNSLENGI